MNFLYNNEKNTHEKNAYEDLSFKTFLMTKFKILSIVYQSIL